ncbi:RNA-directed DNA polymerase, eukaryota, reverse transcriptase zinc-binding domain protein [Tanacetum coccineum]
MGDLNVSLNIEDHSKGISYKTQDMKEFQDCVNSIKMVDLSSTGLHYTWTKSLMNPNSSVLKKIDRVMGSEDFMEVYSRAHAVFLPYGISDHSPTILTCSNDVRKNTKSFRFAIYIADKMEFGSLKLDEVQSKIDGDPHNRALREMGVDVLKEYSVTLEDEEKLLFQRAKVNWLNDGDRNSAFFHKVIKGIINRSIVGEIWSEDNVRYSEDQIPSQFVNHFKNFFGVQSNKECLELDNSLFSKKISDQEAISMIEGVTNEEVKAAMFSIDDNKAPGPDGFTAKFYKKAWHVVGNDVCEAVKEFFAKEKLLGELNATLITLVPKVSTPTKVTDFRPIACCNVDYKCISKIITNRIKSMLDSIVHKNQSAFIPDRQITDNILLTQELLKGYDCVKGPKRCSMKIDIQKAYDTVDWNFLKNTLRLFGFHRKMVKWIMLCVSTPSYSLCINGERHGFFKGGRGLRQGDPMSPYLFTIVMEVFNLIMKQKIKEDNSFKYHHGCKSLEISHLCFADDLLVMCHGDVNSVKVIKRALDTFSDVSSLHPNLNWGQGIDKVKSRIHDWKNKSLSYAGRAQLIAFVLTSIQVYWASIFKLPKTVMKDIEKLFKGFLWCHGDLQKGKAKDSLWVKWINIVKLKGRSVWEVDKQGIDSWIWKNLLELRDEVGSHMQYKIRNGRSISICHDNWVGLPTLDSFISRREIYAAGFSNDDTIIDCISDSSWKWPSEWTTKFPTLHMYKVPILKNAVEHKLMWKNNNGEIMEFASGRVWKDIRCLNRKVQWWKVVWFPQNIPRHAFVLWLAVKGKLVTQDKLSLWHPDKDWKCPLCMKIEDSHRHLFFECDFSKEVWSKIHILAKVFNVNNLEDCVERLSILPCKNNIWSIGRNSDTLYQNITDSIKGRLMTLKVKNSNVVKEVEALWSIHLMKSNASIIGEWLKVNKSKNIYNSGILKEEIKKIDAEIDNGLASDTTINRRTEVLNSIQHLDKIQAMDMVQKAKVKWAIEGDENSRFFMTISLDQQTELESAVSKEEVKKAVWDCGSDKSPGPDGFSVLGDIVNEVQSAFISDRQILDGPFILNEVIQWCKSKKKQSLIFKVDFEKAYDSVRWDFLDDVLKKFGFGNKWFMGQWCDDNINTLVHVLECFFRASGLRINMCKSKIMGVNVGDDKIKAAALKLGCRILNTSFTYLGTKVGGNIALMMKWFWRFHSHNDSLWSRVIKAIYGEDGAVDKVYKSASRSCWRDILNEVRKLKVQGIEQLQFKELTDLLLSIVLNTCSDRWFWSLEGSGEFSVASIRRLIDDQRLLTVDSKTLWIKSVPLRWNISSMEMKLEAFLRIQYFAWRFEIRFHPLAPFVIVGFESARHIFSLLFC